MNVLFISLTLLATAQAPVIEVQTLAGEQVHGAIVSLDSEQLVVEADQQPRSFAVGNLLAIRPAEQQAAIAQMADADSVATLLLVDGSTLRVQDYSVAGSTAGFKVAGQEIQLPVAAIHRVRFGGGPTVGAQQWEQITTTPVAGDLLVVYRSDSLDYLEGILGDVTDERVQFELDGDSLPVRKNKIAGLVYYRPQGAGPTATKCLVVTTHGSQLAATSLSSSETSLQITTGSDLELTLPWTDVRRLDFGQGKVQYLSDLTPQSITWAGYFHKGDATDVIAQYYQPRHDRGFNGQPLRLAGETYARGLALHSRTELIYRLPDQFRRFVATAGIDDSVAPRGAVQLQIWSDDKLLLDQAIRGSDAPVMLDLDITGANRLRILVDYGDQLDVADHLNLCEARILK